MLRWLMVIALLASCRGDVVAPSPSSAATVGRSPTASRTAEPARAPTPDPATLRPCAGSALQAVIAWARSPDDSLVGAVFIANRGSEPCTVRGHPEVSLRGEDGRATDVRVALVSSAALAPAPVVVPVTQLREDPAGVAGVGAAAPLEWENYCASEKVVAFTFTLVEGAGPIAGTFAEPSGVPMRESLTPRCEDAAGTSTLAIYPLQEPRR
ncbi:MAG TPA: DUF4232 domain-containing protein [Candidatus Limnocylindria bacterium]|nr:DUF4232 domain-containing protein [Candidatus Limnocylindria bacterium]